MTVKRRINWIDWAKSVCMFLVVMGHCHVDVSQQEVSQVIHSFHIPLFFFLSGLLCPKRFSRSSLLKDFRYLILPYIFYGFLTMLVFCCLSGDFSTSVLLSRLQSLCLGYDAGIGAIWFLPALFICKQLFYLCQWAASCSRVLGYALSLATLFPAYFISRYGVNLPLFADSALFGLPFLLLGSFCLPLIQRIAFVGPMRLFLSAAALFALTVLLALDNGFVILAMCQYGAHVLVYYLCALSGISFLVLACLLLDGCRLRFITITSYGTIVTLGIHGLILTLLQYHLPVLLGYYTPTILLPVAVLYAAVTYVLCYVVIIFADRYCPHLAGLKGYTLKSGQM